MINTILFDLRDVIGDKKAKIITIPVKFGRNKTFFILMLLNSSLFIWLYTFNDILIKYSHVLLACILYGYAYIILFCFKKTNNSLYNLLIDDEWLLWMTLFYLVG